MSTNRTRAGLAVALALVVLGSPIAPAQAGPIGDMLARHKAQRQMQLPPVEKPFTGRPVKDISPSSMKSRFKKRFTPSAGRAVKGPTGALGSMFHDSGVNRTSR